MQHDFDGDVFSSFNISCSVTGSKLVSGVAERAVMTGGALLAVARLIASTLWRKCVAKSSAESVCVVTSVHG